MRVMKDTRAETLTRYGRPWKYVFPRRTKNNRLSCCGSKITQHLREAEGKAQVDDSHGATCCAEPQLLGWEEVQTFRTVTGLQEASVLFTPPLVGCYHRQTF